MEDERSIKSYSSFWINLWLKLVLYSSFLFLLIMWHFKSKEQKLSEAEAALQLVRRGVADIEAKMKTYPADYGLSPVEFSKSRVGQNLKKDLDVARENLLIVEACLKRLKS